MSLTITVTLDDGDVQQFLDRYNADSGVEVTADMLNQNAQLHEAIAEDMLTAWISSFDTVENEDTISAYDLYCEFLEEDYEERDEDEITILHGDPVFAHNED